MKIFLNLVAIFSFAIGMQAQVQTLPVAKDKNAIRVLVWSEGTEPKNVYPDGIRGTVASIFAERKDIIAKIATLADPEQGLSEEMLNNTDVLIWWGHTKHGDIKNATVNVILKRIKEDGMGLIALHSAHWSKPFMAAMNDRAISDAFATIPPAQHETIELKKIRPKPGVLPKRDDPLTPSFQKRKNEDGSETLEIKLPNCVFPAYRADGKPSHVSTMAPDHPIAKGIPASFAIAQTEMYDEPFHVPKPDTVIFEEKWDLGERFRAGCAWQIGKGKVFYFRPGHETYPVFFDANVRKILANAVVWNAVHK